MNMQRLTDEEVRLILQQENAVHTSSHFVGTSGKHLDAYIDKDCIGRNPRVLDQFAFELAHRLCEDIDLSLHGANIVAVIGAPMGAVAFSSRVTYWINELFPRSDGIMIQSIYAEKDGDKAHLKSSGITLKIRSSFAELLKNGGGAISIEDILNTGGTAEDMLRKIEGAGGIPRRLGAICNRGGVTPEKLGIRVIKSLMNVTLKAYEAKDCPMCRDGVPMRTDLGHGMAFLATQKQA
jgi:orotate phosphoribosyltransferase